MRHGILLALILAASIGCAPQVDRATQPVVATSPAAEQLAAPTPRTFDAAAEKELKEHFASAPDPGKGDVKKYDGVRWRFRAEVMRLDATEPSRFNALTITVQPGGMDRTYVRMRANEEKSKLYPGQTHEFEGTLETLIPGTALVFNDAVLVGS